jgi:cystathionine beta-lyase
MAVKFPLHTELQRTTSGKVSDYDKIPTYPPRPSFKEFENALRINSQVVVFDGCPNDPYRPSSTPLYQTSTFRAPDSSSFGEYDYTRSGNPTRTALEKQVAMLERATCAFAFTSGMSALSIATRLAGDGEILCSDDIYGGMYRLITKVSGGA